MNLIPWVVVAFGSFSFGFLAAALLADSRRQEDVEREWKRRQAWHASRDTDSAWDLP